MLLTVIIQVNLILKRLLISVQFDFVQLGYPFLKNWACHSNTHSRVTEVWINCMQLSNRCCSGSKLQFHYHIAKICAPSETADNVQSANELLTASKHWSHIKSETHSSVVLPVAWLLSAFLFRCENSFCGKSQVRLWCLQRLASVGSQLFSH